MANNIIDFLPNVLKNVHEMRALGEAINPEFDRFTIEVENLMLNQFVSISTIDGIERWEKILNIPSRSLETLDVRRFRILLRLNEQLPHTFRTLTAQLTTLLGEGNYSLMLDHLEYTLTIKIAVAAQGNYDDVANMINRIVPANMIIDLKQLFNTHRVLGNLTYGQLGEYTHRKIRIEVFSDYGWEYDKHRVK